MLPLKSLKTIEEKVHCQLYTNVALLTHFHAPTKEFLAVFHRDMFVKNNSIAFQHVVYYLLNVLNSERIKEKITSWPVFDRKSETEFRKEVIKYLNELNSFYEDAGLPSILMSHVIAPGGLRFAKYMLKLSQLVLHENFKDPDQPLNRIHPNKNNKVTERTISLIKIKTNKINADTVKIRNDFELKIEEYKKEAEKICEEIRLNFDRIFDLKQKLENHLQVTIRDTPINPNVKEEVSLLKEKINHIQIITEKFNRLINFVHPLLKEDFIFTYKPGMYPTELINSSPELNLHHLFEKLCSFTENKSLRLVSVAEKDLGDNIMKFEVINKTIERNIRNLEKIQENLSKIKSQMEVMDCETKKTLSMSSSSNIQNIDSEETLAVPLESSDNSSLEILDVDELIY